MQNNTTLICRYCNHKSDFREFIYTGVRKVWPACQNAEACARRQRRNAAVTQLSATAVHPIDRFSRTAIALSAAIMVSVIVTGLTYIWFGI